MNAGKVIATGSPKEIRARAGKASLEQAFIAMLPEEDRLGHGDVVVPPRGETSGPPAIEARGLTRRFGDFVAVDHVDFEIARGEIFGFLGLERLRQDDHHEDADRAVVGQRGARVAVR